MSIEIFKTSRNVSEIVQTIYKRVKVIQLVVLVTSQPVWECTLDFMENVVLLLSKSLRRTIALSELNIITMDKLSLFFYERHCHQSLILRH